MKKEAQKLVTRLKEKKLTVTIAESMTAGMAATYLAGCSGTSEVFKGGVVCYTPGFKKSVLSVPDPVIKKFTCESEQVTQILAKNLCKLNNSNICAAITGLASKGGSEGPGKPVGTVFLSVYYKKKIHNKRMVFRGAPLEIKKKACEALFMFIISLLK